MAKTFILDDDGYLFIYKDPSEAAQAYRAFGITIAITLFGIFVLSVVSAGLDCRILCCKNSSCCYSPASETEETQNENILLGVQIINNGEMTYFPVGSQVSELKTDHGRMIVLKTNDEVTTSANGSAPPPYQNVVPQAKI